MAYYTVKLIRTGHAYQEGTFVIEADSPEAARDKTRKIRQAAHGEIVTWHTLNFDTEVTGEGEVKLLETYDDEEG